MFLAEFSKYCDKRQQEVGTRITQVTCNKYHRLLRYLTEYTRQQYRKDDLPLNVADSLHLPGQTDVCGSDIPFQPAYMAHSGRFGAFRFGTGGAGDSRYTVFISERPSHTSTSPRTKLRPT